MSHPNQAFVTKRVFDGVESISQAALLVEKGVVQAIVPHGQIPDNAEIVRLESDFIAPGFVDCQVNGGGGILFNDQPTCAGIRTICNTLVTLGTTSIFPTLISDSAAVTRAAINAAVEATKQAVPGFAGLHLEGPHLDPVKHGAHDKKHLCPMSDADLKELIAARKQLPALIVTIAPEAVSKAQVRALVDGGVVVSLGHTNCTAQTAAAYFEAGATMVTHLFNAMSGISAREPGLAAAALNTPTTWCGMVADCFHVTPETMKLALAANIGPGRVFLASDAMPVVGTRLDRFELSGKTVFRDSGTLKFSNGGLAGADLCLAQAVRNMRNEIGIDTDVTLRMASSDPASVVGGVTGRLRAGSPADFITLDDDLNVRSVWLSGTKI